MRNRYIYGPVRSWRSGCSLGVDPIGDISTCSFNCVYCQLGRIQNITTEIRTYVPTEYIVEDLKLFYEQGLFSLESGLNHSLDVITLAGSGEPTLAANLGEIIDSIRAWTQSLSSRSIPISILTNATLLGDPMVRERASKADRLSLKLDAVDEESLKAINQAASGISLRGIVEGIQAFKAEYSKTCDLQLQIMLMPKQIQDPEFIAKLAALIAEISIFKIQLNTPTRPKPKGVSYLIETRGNHYHEASNSEFGSEIEFQELPVISPDQAWALEQCLRVLLEGASNLEIINVYKTPS